MWRTRLVAASLVLALGATACTQPTKSPEGTSTTLAPLAPGSLPALPKGMPTTLTIGASLGDAKTPAQQKAMGLGMRYQYLAGGVQTASNWADWNPDGTFASNYINDSKAAGLIPVFTYYMMVQSNPGASQGEANGAFSNLNNAGTMAAYYANLKLFFQRAKQAGGTVVLHVEPDLWAFLHQRASNDDPATVPAKVSGSGFGDVAGLPDNVAGFAQAIVRLRDMHAPNVVLGYHVSSWGTGDDYLYSDPSDARVSELGRRSAQFYQRLGARFDVAFTDIADRDAEFKRAQYGDDGRSWMGADDYRRTTVFIGEFTRVAHLRMVVWQIPFGNTKMRAMNNSWGHYQDNKVEWLLDDPGRGHLDAFVRSGVIAFLFGAGAGGATCACDGVNDGVTNPGPINGNNRASLNADDDGGFFEEKAKAYAAAGPVRLP